jgi:hypothetical protein
MAVASEEVYLLPLSLPVSSKDGPFKDGIKGLNDDIELAASMPNNEIAKAVAHDANSVLTGVAPYLQSDSLPTTTVINASVGTVQLAVAEFGREKTMYGSIGQRPPSTATERKIRNEKFWEFASGQAIASATTSREGKFTMNGLPAGKFIIACRVFKPTLKAALYWAVTIDTSGSSESKIDLTPSNAVVVGY